LSVPDDDRLEPVAHAPRVAVDRKEQEQPLDVADARERHDGHRDRHQPRLPARDPVLDLRLVFLDRLQARDATVDVTTIAVEAYVTRPPTPGRHDD
jgi:hypothetical protein